MSPPGFGGRSSITRYRAVVPTQKHGAPDGGGRRRHPRSPDEPGQAGVPGHHQAEVLEYYLLVGGLLLDQVAGRPTALERWPDGVLPGVEHFFQKHLPKSAPDYVHGIRVSFPSGRPGVLLDPSTRASIAWAVQMGTITFHAWPVTSADVEHPDQLRIDLDPSAGQ